MFKRMVGDLVRRPAFLASDASATAAAEAMIGQDVSCLAVVAGRKVVGFVTERDLCLHLDVDLEPDTPVVDLVSRDVAVIAGAMFVDEAVRTMLERRTRHLVVTGADGNLAGLVTDKELVDSLAVDFMVENVTCQAVTRPDCPTLDPQAPVREGLRLMRERGFGSVLAVADGKPAGIFTERDAIAKILGRPERLAEPLADHMSAPVVSVPATAMVYKVILFMRQRGVRRVAVVAEDGTLAGIIAQHHLLAYARRLV